MINKTTIATGTVMILAGLGEKAVMRAPCPTCIAAIGGGSILIAKGVGIKK